MEGMSRVMHGMLPMIQAYLTLVVSHSTRQQVSRGRKNVIKYFISGVCSVLLQPNMLQVDQLVLRMTPFPVSTNTVMGPSRKSTTLQ